MGYFVLNELKSILLFETISCVWMLEIVLLDVLRFLLEVTKKPKYVCLSKFCEKSGHDGIICGCFDRVVKYLERLKAVISE